MSGQIRGVRMGSHVQLGGEDRAPRAPRSEHLYRTETGHEFTVVFAEGAEIPDTWTSQYGTGRLIGEAGTPAPHRASDDKHPRSHWDMLRERRSEAELEEILNEQLVRLRERRRRALDEAEAHGRAS